MFSYLIKNKFAVVDIETTGLSPRRDEIVEICIIKILNGRVQNLYETLVKPTQDVSFLLTKIHGIDNDMLAIAPEKSEVTPIVKEKLSKVILVEHSRNDFDSKFLEVFLSSKPWHTTLNTLSLAKKLYPNLDSYSLYSLCKHKSISLKQHHTAKGDAIATAKLLITFLKESSK